MTRRRKVIVVVLVLVLVVTFCAILIPSGPPDPIYDGKPLSYWVAQPVPNSLLVGGFVITLSQPTAHRVDAQAVPYLLSALERGDDTGYKFRQFIWTNSPAWLQSRLTKPAPASLVRLRAATMLTQLGDDALPAIPALIQILEHNPNALVRLHVVNVLGAIGKNDSAAAKALIKAATNDPDANVRATALDFLLRLNPERTRRAERSGKALASLAPSFEAP
jgi:hypothetical protein